jgi:hypothetical protein
MQFEARVALDVGCRMTEQRLLCCVCGRSTDKASNYVHLRITAEGTEARQFLGAHAECLDKALAPGFSVEVHLM